ncbi:hypothetical protein ACHHYP_01626 [Achlya hypogyna]|uniref:Kinesin motor domain-containing protein n=1 Tax=Achlya hypogyna TaxID=1202772 RepID=A0A1V9Z820_ACHHY|nr:hypothetical protein ACHHYP_01626 [Achlya hypogyna]
MAESTTRSMASRLKKPALRRPVMRLPFEDDIPIKDLEDGAARYDRLRHHCGVVSPPASPATTDSPVEEEVVRPLIRSRLRVPTSYRDPRGTESRLQIRRRKEALPTSFINGDTFTPPRGHNPTAKNESQWKKSKSPETSPSTLTDFSDDDVDLACQSPSRIAFTTRQQSLAPSPMPPDTPDRQYDPRRSRLRLMPTKIPVAPPSETSTPARVIARRPLFPPPSPTRSTEQLLEARVHYLTEALVAANQHHKKTQEHLAWALQEFANSPVVDACPAEQPTPGVDRRALLALADQVDSLQDDHAALKAAFRAGVSELLDDLARLGADLVHRARHSHGHLDARVQQLQAQHASLLKERRALHNTIQELRGNIRVFCRLRPVAGKVAVVVNSEQMVTVRPDDRSNQEAVFSVDKVFDQKHSQLDDVFHEVAPLVTSALDGYNVCILAYGQTGSGKTHTMLGDLRSADTSGLCVRVFHQLFDAAASDDYETHIEVSCVEIYNEKLVDLLVPGQPSLEIHVDKKAGVSVPQRKWVRCTPAVVGLTSIVAVESVQSCVQTMDKALRHRAVGANDLNDKSSRSHWCASKANERLSLGVASRRYGYGGGTARCRRPKMHLVDLAGSERLGSSNSHGDRRLEAQHINKSLSALRHVLLQLKNKEAFVSYRNSKLTMLLQDAIGGNAKTLLLVCVNPLAANALETKCSLVFGERANAVELGRAHRHHREEPLDVELVEQRVKGEAVSRSAEALGAQTLEADELVLQPLVLTNHVRRVECELTALRRKRRLRHEKRLGLGAEAAVERLDLLEVVHVGLDFDLLGGEKLIR